MMLDTVNILEGSTFVTSDRRGDIDGTPITPHGLFALDTRFLSRWRLTLDGQSLAVLSADTQRYFGAQFFLAPSTGTTYVDSPMSVVRRRWIEGGLHEQVGIFNHTPEPRHVHLRLEVDADFADLFEVKDALAKKGHLYRRIEPNGLVLGYERDAFRRETQISIDAQDAQISEGAIEIDVDLAANGAWMALFQAIPFVDGFPSAPATFSETPDETLRRLDKKTEGWRQDAPRVRSDWRPAESVYNKSIDDLAALRLKLPTAPDAAMPAAGLPWFMSLFGRDSLITSYQALPFMPNLALDTLKTLASMQGRRVDAFRDEEPGKILHELRFGELTAFEERPHSPYFGSADSTTLWLILLDEYERWTGREDVVRQLEPAARAALKWIDEYGDRDGDGFIEYKRGIDETGLDNQCWKDSWDAIRFKDGRIAELPRATCELQGYAYDAKIRCARLARDIWGDSALAEQLEQGAAELKRRFNREFWLADKGYYALALDKDKAQVDSLTSNIGHLLWSGIVDEDKVQPTVDKLMGESMFSGWGIRTMAHGEGAYNPIGYHVGTVWPHDNSIIAMGLARYGYRQEAAQIAQAMTEAAMYFDARLPEAFAGYPRNLTNYPAEYPTACSPQAWATGTPLLLMRAVMGLEPQGARLTVDPVLPQAIGQLEISGIPGRWGRVDVSADAARSLMAALEAAAAEAPGAIRELFAALDESAIPAMGDDVATTVGFRLGDGGDWLIGVNHGKVQVQETFDVADCVMEMSEETLMAILRGDQNARTPRCPAR
ncbi:MAG: amylo-alpha-1,6-glucosidase [Dehalococcoidia bacterium]|nr:amylo-alpha-1,6-glucosidase [Dehalococcoidia bacterium]